MKILYLVKPNGTIISLHKKCPLNSRLNKSGYRTVNAFRTTKLIHRLIAQVFVPNPMNKPFVNHLDGNKLNCDYTNLVWCTQQENIIHAWKTGLSKPRGCKLSDTAVHDIRTKRISLVKFGKLYRVSPRAVAQVQEGRTYKHVPLK
ncbi:HNH endonuclease [Vibrio virus vB_VspP_SBP1]|uniref:HNH endonuclease n=1 Tax=Vibrio virus vB_VspP_SBP1 TaxID=2500581 RepID=A0A3T0IIK4_9CAUD|nr:HNH endonuclease [Vibrio virus vB_VspP_SBP1]AZU99599.1 HNH endonuclease [Vibrio virus vB_VspP_SBP1]